jgi:hypothetical protein
VDEQKYSYGNHVPGTRTNVRNGVKKKDRRKLKKWKDTEKKKRYP